MLLNILNVPMETHLLFACAGRSPLQVEAARGARALAREKGLDAHLIMRLEMEAAKEELIGEVGSADSAPDLADTLRQWDEVSKAKEYSRVHAYDGSSPFSLEVSLCSECYKLTVEFS